MVSEFGIWRANESDDVTAGRGWQPPLSQSDSDSQSVVCFPFLEVASSSLSLITRGLPVCNAPVVPVDS